ncbi:hypothetical protein LMJ04_08020, partial [Klebsiella pneumoniae]|nr:hypothetical protein [Klebsiella pneumoniae]
MAEVPLPTPTQNPVPSTDIRDVVFAGAKLDEEITSLEAYYVDRLGGRHLTSVGRDGLFSDQLGKQRSDFIYQYNQQAHAFDAQLSGQQSRFETVMKNAGSQVLGRYEDGPWTITDYNQLISYGGTFWKLAASVVIGSGYTTAGNSLASWNATDKKNFVDVGQDQLRSELGTIF